MADYPASLTSFTTKTNKVDSYDASHVNAMQDEIVAIETERGTHVAGSKTNLVDRLAVVIEDNGALNQGTSYPGSPVDGQIFYRTDLNTASIYNGSSWDALGESLSNVIFCWNGFDTSTADQFEYYTGTNQQPAMAVSATYSFISVRGTTYRTVLRSKYTHLASISTITCYARMWRDTAGTTQTCQVTIGGQTGSGTTASTTPAWTTGFTVDVSGLSDATNYDMTVETKSDSGSGNVYLGAIICIAS